MNKLKKALWYLWHEGPRALISRILQKLKQTYDMTYGQWYQSHQADAKTLRRQAKECFSKPMLLSIVVPVYNTNPVYLREMVESFIAQSYSDWEACLYDGASTSVETREELHKLELLDSRVHVRFGDRNDGIAENTNHAIAMAHGEYIALCDHDDVYTPDALYCFRKRIDMTDADVLYSDEDLGDCKMERLSQPHFKPDFSPDLLRERNYICHLMMIRTQLMTRLGGLNGKYDGSQDHDLVLRASEITTKIEHIPRVLYHWRMISGSMSHQNAQKCLDAGRRAVEAHLNRLNIDGRCETFGTFLHTSYPFAEAPSATLIWVKRKGRDTAGKLPLVLARAKGIQLHPIVVGAEPCAKEFSENTITAEQDEALPALLNRAVSMAQTPLVVVMDSDILPADGWAEPLLMHARRPQVGLVTSAIYSGQGSIACAGYAVGNQRLVKPRFEGLGRYVGGIYYLEKVTNNITAVPWEYCAFAKETFVSFGGFDESFTDSLFDVDLCLRMLHKGYTHIYTPLAHAALSETKAFPDDDKESGKKLIARYPDLYDPYYPPSFDPATADFSMPRA